MVIIFVFSKRVPSWCHSRMSYRVSRMVVKCIDCGEDSGLYPELHACGKPNKTPSKGWGEVIAEKSNAVGGWFKNYNKQEDEMSKYYRTKHGEVPKFLTTDDAQKPNDDELDAFEEANNRIQQRESANQREIAVNRGKDGSLAAKYGKPIVFRAPKPKSKSEKEPKSRSEKSSRSRKEGSRVENKSRSRSREKSNRDPTSKPKQRSAQSPSGSNRQENRSNPDRTRQDSSGQRRRPSKPRERSERRYENDDAPPTPPKSRRRSEDVDNSRADLIAKLKSKHNRT